MADLPESCAHCGVPRREHRQRWTEGVGWHPWTAPSAEQLLARTRGLREAAALERYYAALASGLSDYEAREEGWPTHA